MDNLKWTIQRNWEHTVHKTKTHDTKTQHNRSPLCTIKTNNVNKTWTLQQTIGHEDDKL
jgi:hypothetical protein